MPPTGRPGSIPAKRATAIAASWRSCSWSMFIERGEEHLGELLVAHALAGAAAPLLAGHAAGLLAVSPSPPSPSPPSSSPIPPEYSEK